MTKTPTPLLNRNIKRILGEHTTVLVYCWSRWCPHCGRLTPLINQLTEAYADRVLVCSLNAEENRRAIEEYQITFLPTLLLFKEGELVDQMSGAVGRGDIEKMMNKHLDMV